MTLSEQIVVPECSRMVLALQELSAEAKLWWVPSSFGRLWLSAFATLYRGVVDSRSLAGVIWMLTYLKAVA